MADILIRGVGADVVATIDASAERVGLSRSEYVRRVLERERRAGLRRVSVADLEQLSDLVTDLDDPDVMAGAWS